MKKLFLIVLLALCTVPTINLTAQDIVPNYGVTTDGDYFIRKDAVNKVCTVSDLFKKFGGYNIRVNGDKVLPGSWEAGWSNLAYYEYQGVDVYVFRSGITVGVNEKVHFCFEVNGTCFFPTAAVKSGSSIINLSDVEENPWKNGYNLFMTPVSFRFQ